ncbi:hypothetical protein [Humisphaera borealis]|uniref:Uncharacterized protein n=1 Tax=Humisphaera borealis TaxID=2807512 RepID=A0A7M2WQ89_9BACT|nr:hypothetical protein [Humisphaera borealis]QOV87412.1 hypothetical protein IPV69_14040 [Humisphaera borealis]
MPFRFFTLFKRPLHASGRKALAMSQTSTPATPPDDRLSRLIDAVGQLSRQQQTLLDGLKASPTPSPAPNPLATASSSPAVSPADLRAFVADLFRQHSATAARSIARDEYLRQHLSDLPEAYRRLMPKTADDATLADAEQKVRRQFRDDLRSAGQGGRSPATQPAAPSAPDVGFDPPEDFFGTDPGGQSPAAAIDYSKLSPMQQIALGLRGSPSKATPAAEAGSNRHPRDARSDQRAPAPDVLDGEPLFVGAD